MKGKKEGNFSKCVMNVEVVTFKISKYNITTLMNVSLGFHFAVNMLGKNGSENSWP